MEPFTRILLLGQYKDYVLTIMMVGGGACFKSSFKLDFDPKYEFGHSKRIIPNNMNENVKKKRMKKKTKSKGKEEGKRKIMKRKTKRKTKRNEGGILESKIAKSKNLKKKKKKNKKSTNSHPPLQNQLMFQRLLSIRGPSCVDRLSPSGPLGLNLFFLLM